MTDVLRMLATLVAAVLFAGEHRPYPCGAWCKVAGRHSHVTPGRPR
jgi:hypothetical protein